MLHRRSTEEIVHSSGIFLSGFGSGVCILLLFATSDICDGTELKMGQESEVQTTLCGQYGYFEIDVTHPCDDLHIQVRNISGEPNLYVSTVELPTYRSLAWSSYEWGGENMKISSWDPSFKTGRYYIGVHSYCGSDVPTGHQDAKYTVQVKQVPHQHPVKDDLFNRTASGMVRNGTYERHRFCIPSDCFLVEVALSNCIDPKECPTSYAWPELIISPKEQYATEKSMAWILGEAERRSIVLQPNAREVHPGHYYITVFGWCTPDHVCHDKAQCGPCSYALQTQYNISVIAANLCARSRSRSVAPSASLLLVTGLFTLGILKKSLPII